MSGSVITLINDKAESIASRWISDTDDGKSLASIHFAGDFTGTMDLYASNKPYDEAEPPGTDEFELVESITTKGLYYVDPQLYEQYQVDFTRTTGNGTVWIKTRNDQ